MGGEVTAVSQAVLCYWAQQRSCNQKDAPNIVWSRRPPLRFLVACHAREGVGDSGGFRQRRRVGAAHTNR